MLARCALLVSVFLVGVVGCTYIGTPNVESRMLDRIATASERLKLGTMRDDAMRSIPAGEKLKWGEGVGVDDQAIVYQEWRLYADDAMDRVDDRDPIRYIEMWMYFQDGVLYLKSGNRVPLSEQAGVRQTWRRGGRLDVFGQKVNQDEGAEE